MKKKLALLLAALLLFGSAACGKTDTADDTQQEIQTEFNLPKCGLSYTIPDEWVEMENTNLIPASYVKVNGDIYAKIQYNYAPDENMEPLNDAESTIAVEELMTPIVEMLVVRTENLETDEVKEEMDFFKSVEKIGVKGDFQFFFLTDYADGIDHFSAEAQATFPCRMRKRCWMKQRKTANISTSFPIPLMATLSPPLFSMITI